MKCFNCQVSLKLILILLIVMQSACTKPVVVNSQYCPNGKSIPSKDGTQRLALIVGIGQYKSDSIPDLLGPPEDAKRFYELLTGKQGYDFPKENVCLLLNEEATTENVKKYFNEILVNRAGAKDEAVFFYAGHGSQTEDINKDEQDGLDETLVLQDARSGDVNDFIDDEFDGLLQSLYSKTKQISVFLDSCNSGTALRGDDEGFVSRFIPPAKSLVSQRSTDDNFPAITSDAGWVSSSMPGIVTFTAAGDGTTALERSAHGVFTDAILTTFGQINATKLTYAQAARQIKPLIKAQSYQIPFFQGDLQRVVFSNSTRTQPLSWEVIEVGNTIKIGGLPLPGIGKNAEFRVYDGSITGADTQDPGKVKAVIVIDESTGVNANAHILSQPQNADAIKPGDLAVLARPSDEQASLKITLRPESQPGGISTTKAEKLVAALSNNSDAIKVLAIVPIGGDFEVSLDNENKFVIKGPENSIRSTVADENNVIKNLLLHAKQRVFSSLLGEGGKEFTDQETLQVQIVPAKKQEPCVEGSSWQQQEVNSQQAQEIPLCYNWNVMVRLNTNARSPLLVGGLVLSTDGGIFGFPADVTAAPLNPGEKIVFASAGETFKASPPLNIEDQIIVFGTKQDNPVPWARLTENAATRSADLKGGLYRTVDRFLSGTRGVEKVDEPQTKPDTTWTRSSITLRVFDPKSRASP